MSVVAQQSGMPLGRMRDDDNVIENAHAHMVHVQSHYSVRHMTVLVYVLLTTSRTTLNARPSCTVGRMHCWSK
ncbi:MAG: hypothetical protein EON49_19625 [Acidovorax sp.]|nr:MAG: hypothetical protein EON49_19625 [Acidovorax sp.]